MTQESFHNEILSMQDKLYRYALSIVLDGDAARDVVQEVLLKLWKKREQLQDIQNKEAWCIRMIRNQAIDKTRRRRTEDLQTMGQLVLTDQSPAQQTEEQDLIQAIKQIMKGLPENQKEIFRLRELMGYTNAEIEKILTLNHSQVKVNLFRARKTIRERLTKLVNYGIHE